MTGWWERVRSALGIGGAREPKVVSRTARTRRPARPGDIVQAFIDGLLHHDNPDVRAGAARKLGELGPRAGRRAVEALESALYDDDAGVRSSAALSLGEFGTEASSCIEALIEALGDPDDDVRSSAGIALEDIGAVAMPALERALDDKNALVQAEAKVILRRWREE